MVGVRISVGLKPDVGLNKENSMDESIRDVSKLL